MKDGNNHTLNADQQQDVEPLMAVYNPEPPQPEPPARFYWQEPWQNAATDAVEDAVQAAFEN